MARVLLVDDDADIRDTTTLRLELEGHEVTAVPDAETALTAATTGAGFDIAVVDVELPGTDGVALVKTLRDLDATRHLPLVFYTARWSAEAAAEGTVLADAYLTKRQPLSQLLDTITTLTR
ncbi:response regulator [Actinoplanes sp. NPDC000266]